MGLFDSQSIEIPCPQCGHKHPKTIGWIKAHSEISCRCGVTVQLDKGQFVSEMAKVDKMLDEFPRKIEVRL